VIPAEAARALDEDEYWDHDLIGCSVVTADGTAVGRVTDVLHQPASSILVVQGEREHLIPLIRDVVRSVEPGTRITIDPLPGLLDD
jgi:16S rRNA processing protein RimM